MTKFARALTPKNCKSQKIKKIFFFKFPPGYLLIILYQLSKFEAPSCYNFWDIKFSVQICKGQ